MGSQVKLTDAEITRRLAEGCMGWKFADAKDESGGCRFSFRLNDANEPIWSSVWQPIHNEAHAAEVREAMRAKGWSIYQGAIPVEHLPHSASVFKVGGLYVSTRAQLSTAALCHAALLALGLAKEEEL